VPRRDQTQEQIAAAVSCVLHWSASIPQTKQVASQPLHFPATVRAWRYERSGILSTVSYHLAAFSYTDIKTLTMKNRVTAAEMY
jgi:hypothetical protein